MTGNKDKKKLSEALTGFRSATVSIFFISGVVNVLALTGALYMLQIYDRALTSQSVPTLAALSVLAIGLYLFQGTLDVIRSQVLVRLGATVDCRLAPIAHRVSIDMPRYGFSTTEALERVRDVDNLRHFLGSQAPIALFDLPWMPLYLIFVYFLHPWLGALTLAGIIILSILTLITELLTRGISKSTNEISIKRMAIADSNSRNADILQAMGFANRAVKRFETANSEHLALQTKANDVGGTLSGVSRVLRMILQSAILGLGAYLTIQGQLTAGAIIAGSVAAARALAPIDMVIANWKNVVAARRSYGRLGETVAAAPNNEATQIRLPVPVRSLKVEKITVAAPSTGAVVVTDIGFELKAGQALGLIGPSGSGKSSLAKAITGVWPLVRGSVRLDDAEIGRRSPEDIGQHFGYLPQDVALLDGTTAENICRFEEDSEHDLVIAAAKSAGVYELIQRLPHGFETQMGPQGTALSGGQRQRIALARALYRDPFLVVLDEPNSNLDAEGDAALAQAINNIRARNGIAVVIAHRPSALDAVDLVGFIQEGKLVAFGPKEEILKQIMVAATETKPNGHDDQTSHANLTTHADHTKHANLNILANGKRKPMKQRQQNLRSRGLGRKVQNPRSGNGTRLYPN